MSDKLKLTPEEFQAIKDQQLQYQKYLLELGALALETEKTQDKLDQLKQNKDYVLADIKSLDEKADALQQELTTKYGGALNVDINTGEFVLVSA